MRRAPQGRTTTGPTATCVALAALCTIVGCGSGASRHQPSPTQASTATPQTVTATRTPPWTAPPDPKPHRSFAVGMRVMTFTDHSRSVTLPGKGTGPRTLVTMIRYPAQGPASRVDSQRAPPVRGVRFPLVVFGHGYTVMPAIYSALLQAWARAGYVVAAPIFPLENANASGGPDESD